MQRKFEDDDEHELLADGENVRVRLDMMDGISDLFTHHGGYVLDEVQAAIANGGRKAMKQKSCEEEDEDMDDNDFEDEETVLHDGTGNLSGHRPGYVFGDSDPLSEANWNKQRLNDEYKADVSSRWKGGLQAGDKLSICGHSLTVTERKPNGNLMVTDSSTIDGDTAKRNAYDAYDSGIQDAYKKKRKKVAEEEEESEPSDQEWSMAGPLSDGQQTKDAAYASYDDDIANRWRK